MDAILEKLSVCVERGRATRDSPHPPDLAGQDGAAEHCLAALEAGVLPADILSGALIPGMRRIGDRYEVQEAFIPELIMAARAMNAAMDVLRPHFSGSGPAGGETVILGTVAGDVHDIGKNIVRMVLSGEGFEVVDLGVDVTTEGFLAALEERPGSVVAMSALLTSTMARMAESIATIKELCSGTSIYIGGAPVTAEFAARVGADAYFPDPHSFARHLSAPPRMPPDLDP